MNEQSIREFSQFMIPIVAILIPLALFLVIKFSKSKILHVLINPLFYVGLFCCLLIFLGEDLIGEQYNKRVIDNYRSNIERNNVGSEDYFTTYTYISDDENAVFKENTITFLIYAIAILSSYFLFRIDKSLNRAGKLK